MSHPDGTGLIASDPWLAPHADALRRRFAHFHALLERVADSEGLTGEVSLGHEFFGFNRGELDEEPGVWYREWAPAAKALLLTGDFNHWDRGSHPLERDDFGVWSIFLPDREYAGRFVHGGLVKVHVVTDFDALDRIPAYIRRAVQDPNSKAFAGQYWNPPAAFAWKHAAPKPRGGLRIYEAHVGMAQEEGKVSTYAEFTERTLPRIVAAGYNAVQLMAVMEHPYYGSFGYHVSSFFAPSSRFGTPEELKALIDAAHGAGLLVFLDIVHSHCVKNLNEGISRFDGTQHQYFHAGGRGIHEGWDSMLFDYSKYEVLRFLLSNVRYWLEEFRFDGFRFDGVTSMMYWHHGMYRTFTNYNDYFSDEVDPDAIAYLQAANALVHTLRPEAVTIAEDVSGMPGLARPIEEGGLGFDYRLAMGVPDYWIKIIKERKDEDWNLGDLFAVLMNRRRNEKHVAYAESHDQALVGDKTIAFRLMDAEMYWNMARGRRTPVIDRGLALHELIRLITFAAGGEAWLNFIGNEFGHPEWVDFPREGNGWSHHHARRQWSLVDNGDLLYRDLAEFDKAMQRIDERFRILPDPLIELLWVHEDRKVIVFRRGPLVFAFNFHPSESYAGLRLGVPDRGDYRVVLDSDSPAFGGFGRTADGQKYPWQDVGEHGRAQSVQVYLPSRTAQVLGPV
jgi:1,4-alpha-glucan branching enzyme